MVSVRDFQIMKNTGIVWLLTGYAVVFYFIIPLIYPFH